MRTSLIILSLALLVSCGKKSNNISNSADKEAFEQKNFLTIPHEENKSLIRGKILNSLVEQTFPALVNTPENEIQKNDELNNFEISDRDLKNYQEKEKVYSKVIVSFSDREEIYFVPERVLVADLISDLELSPEVARVLKMLPVNNEKTYKGGVIYIVSVNHEDLMKNDQKFYKTQTSAMKGINGQSLLIDSHKSVFLSVDYDFYLQKVAPQTFGGKMIRCTPDLRESGMCGLQCAYKRNMPSGEFEKVTEKTLGNLGFVVKYANKTASTSDLVIMNQTDSHFDVKIESQEVVGDDYALEIVQLASSTYSRSASGYDYTGACSGSERNVYGDVALQSKVNFSVTMTILGRGTELKRVRL
ncbi:hypothetical protein SHI21_12030 [Bacteriovorax sp. PP10]|uniref:Lipoprotein n=1 Tax=Bacteriovorax antarcticus TaxID=3088717 RepID=A0ABU5VV68_9BACT|nr:hypothetical protein [Bacteriovorax sp. PP10]MEA9356943.1 hypothetical protein [Bacteriovorax sp. PP10]